LNDLKWNLKKLLEKHGIKADSKLISDLSAQVEKEVQRKFLCFLLNKQQKEKWRKKK
jgi:hypothetical protein